MAIFDTMRSFFSSKRGSIENPSTPINGDTLGALFQRGFVDRGEMEKRTGLTRKLVNGALAQLYRNNGYNAQRISTHAIEWQIQQYDVINDAIGYSYQQDGHLFYILTFPTANATWCYDATTGAWHERAGWDGVKFVRHRSNCQANFNNEILVGDWLNGLVYAFDPEIYSDNNAIQRWLRSWRALPTGQNDLRRTAHHTLQLDCEAGVGVLDAETFLLLLEDAGINRLMNA